MRHQVSCAVYDPSPGNCTCDAPTDYDVGYNVGFNHGKNWSVEENKRLKEQLAKADERYNLLVGSIRSI